ncbi:MAG: RNase adaptor protein RapZ [Elusimicrobia bacterium RIFOXYA12_FULL_51_18]|nr:MAG: RNase adaptor protein RapZ [Elusimicrobia bacterium RIFOXYA12_FULL_51_18]OGS29244.1 MAG: RNase adaptor protein RapZ [Elusimicrobia bacterium RIFOXYA2_FULL_53_38]
MRSNKGKIFIITGMSGAGKSQALKCFEDLGFYCIDNLPVALIPAFSELVKTNRHFKNVALGIDIREGRFFKGFVKSLDTLGRLGLDYKVIFMDASDPAILQRFSETRHRHPLGKNISQAVREERKILFELKERANKVIDTSNLTLGELKEILAGALELKRSTEMKLTVISFGYKYGIPLDADLVMDVRFLPNPNYIPRLKHRTGLDKPVGFYISSRPGFKRFIADYTGQIKHLLPLYIKEGKSYLTIAIGCTGGKHRSVFIASQLAQNLSRFGFSVSEYHRDIRK